MKNAWQLNRRTFLRSAAGTTLALPLLDVMAATKAPAAVKPRMACMFFHYGVPMPPAGSTEYAKYGYYPTGEGANFQFTKSHAALEPFRDKLTYFGGLSHPYGRKISGHAAGDIFLTGADISGGEYRQSVSVDQVAAQIHGDDLRFKSQIYSSSGGIGRQFRSRTLSYDSHGRPIPSQHDPKEIFRQLFGAVSPNYEQELDVEKSVLDSILGEARSLNRRLGRHDREKMDEYLTSVRETEQRIGRAQKWLHLPKPTVDASQLALDADPKDPKGIIDYIRVKYDLMALAFQTDSTRVATYQVAGETTGVERQFPLAAGIDKDSHAVSHDKENYEQWSAYNQMLVNQFAYFVERLNNTPEGNGTLLDNCMLLHGSATSTTHSAKNYPLIMAGGANLGIRHGQYLKFNEDKTPMSNLLLTMLNRMGSKGNRFKDSTGILSEILV